MVGMLSTHWNRPYVAPERDLRNLDILARQAADLLERKRNEEALREADRRKDEFLATLAHELRNPLAPIRNSLTVMRMTDSPELVRDMLERQVHHLIRLVDDLLDVSRITRGTMTLRREPIELDAVVRHAMETIRPLAEALGHEVTVDLPKVTVWLNADPVRMAQVFNNLLNNACKYTGPKGHILLSAERQGHEVLVRVRDTGIGIPRDRLSSIFDMFSQVDRSLEKTQGGLGIGLTLVRSLVEMHGGSVTAHSDGPGKGSEFTIRLPRIEAHAQPDALPGQSTAAPRHVLVVEDNPDARDTLRMLLELGGHRVETAADGAAALEKALALQPELALIDVGLPTVDGYEVARRIRASHGIRRPYLIALTGYGSPEDRARAVEAGFDRHVVKPVDPETLSEIMAMPVSQRED
jgi:CheY-like chemotaxis protein/nitrogen-specific signal transduction histidine kinase